MQKNALIKELKSKTGITQQQIKRFLKAFTGSVGNSISADQKVTISGLGTFEIRKRKKKSIVNPNNPFEKIILPERKVVKYLAGKTIKDDLKKLYKDESQKLSKETATKSPNMPKDKPKSKHKFKLYAPLSQKTYKPKKNKDKKEKNLASEKKKSIDELVEEISDEVEKKETRQPQTPQKEMKIKKSRLPQPKILPQKITPKTKEKPISSPPKAKLDSKTPEPVKTPITPQTIISEAKNSPQIKPAVISPNTQNPPKSRALKKIEVSRPAKIGRGKPFSDIQKTRKFVQKPSLPAKNNPTAQKQKLPKGVKIPYIDLSKKTISKKILSKIPEYIARLYQAVPVDIDEDSKKLIVAMADPEDYQAMEFIKKKTGYQVEPRLATHVDIGRILDQYSGIEAEVESAIKGTEFAGVIKEAEAKATAPSQKKEEVSSTAPTSRVVQSILHRAVSSKASDVHIEPEEDSVIIRFRIDGVLQKVITLPKKIQASITSRVKILSGMKIDEQRLPQDGRFQIKFHDREIDFRVSTFPSINGEKVVLRILDKSTGILSLDELGLTGDGFKRLDEAIHKSHGMALVTGPTGSGKTTTLYAVIDRIMNVGINIVTLEDPVEYQIKGINQGQVRADIGFTFAKGLRSIVRQDPDVIMVGEIRDLETAEMAVHAALTGHVVLSTLHTNDAAGAIPRLIDMGVEPFLITSSLATVVGQRLTRKICDQCKVEDHLSEGILAEIKEEIDKMPEKEKKKISSKDLKFYKGKGCQACDNSGYKGRIGVFEVLPMTPGMQELALKKVSADQITDKATEEGMITMKQDGIIKSLEGKTTIEEVWRVTKE